MVGMVLNAIMHKYDMSVDEGGGGKDKNVCVKGVLVNMPMPKIDKDGMDTMSMVELIVRSMCFGMVKTLGS